MINILVTGGNGQLANCIKDIATNYTGFNFIFAGVEDLDITDLNKVRRFFNNQTIHFCVNCAAYTAVDKAESDKKNAQNVNAVGAKNLAIVSDEKKTTLIHISTDFVFDGKKAIAYKETDITNPTGVYGVTKLEGEYEVSKHISQHFILRTSWLYSEYGNNFMKTMLRLAKTSSEINVVSDQIGTPTYAKDLAGVILKIINSNNKEYGLYHYSNEGVASWYDFANTIFELSNSKIKVNPIKTEAYPTQAVRPSYSVLDKSKIKNTLQIEIPHWRESLVKAILNNIK